MVKLSVKYRRNFMQIILTKDEYDQMKPNELNNTLVAEIIDYVEKFNNSNDTSRYVDLSTWLRNRLNTHQRNSEEQQP
jgi:hypothetical protein